jgi:hypothetical protein
VTSFHGTQLKSKLDKLSKTLAKESLRIPVEAREEEIALRPVLLQALEVWDKSSFAMGHILCEYRAAYRSTGDRTWGLAEEAIAATVGCSPRTLRRLTDRYREAIGLPETVRDAMGALGINPMKATSSKIVSNLLYLVAANSDPDENEAAELVARANAADPRSNYVALTREQKLMWRDRMALRSMLNRSNAGNRLRDLIKALEQEVWVWGITQPMDVRIVPCPDPFTIDGFLKAGTRVYDFRVTVEMNMGRGISSVGPGFPVAVCSSQGQAGPNPSCMGQRACTLPSPREPARCLDSGRRQPPSRTWAGT